MIDLYFEHFKDKPSEKFKELFGITKKRDVVKYAKQTVFSDFDLPQMIFGCGALGYMHSHVFVDDEPNPAPVRPEGEITPEYLRKVYKVCSQQKRTAFHYFTSPFHRRWHLVFFNTNESYPTGLSRFAYAESHMHFVNHLWANLNLKQVFESMPKRPTGVHLKLETQQADVREPTN